MSIYGDLHCRDLGASCHPQTAACGCVALNRTQPIENKDESTWRWRPTVSQNLIAVAGRASVVLVWYPLNCRQLATKKLLATTGRRNLHTTTDINTSEFHYKAISGRNGAIVWFTGMLVRLITPWQIRKRNLKHWLAPLLPAYTPNLCVRRAQLQQTWLRT